MNEIDIKKLKEAINQIVEGILDADIKKGRNLLELCKKYDIINEINKEYICKGQGHMQQVINFIDQIISKYSNLIDFYNILNGYSSNNNNNNQIDCRNIKTCIDFLETVKIIKDKIDKISSYNELMNILKNKNNEI